MPELPEVEVVRRGIAPILIGQPLVSVWASGKPLRSFSGDSARLQPLIGQYLQSVERRSKTLVLAFDQHHLRLHLGMSGVLRAQAGQASGMQSPDLHTHLVLGFESATLWLRDPRRFGDAQVCPPDADWPASAKGLEPLSGEFTAEAMSTSASGVRQAVKPWLMAGTAVVGVGNIYACEALFRAGIHPARAAGRIAPARMRLLVQVIQAVLSEAIARGGSTLRDFHGHDGEQGLYRADHLVYGRQGHPCPRCQRPIRRIVQAQRSTFYCSGCQR